MCCHGTNTETDPFQTALDILTFTNDEEKVGKYAEYVMTVSSTEQYVAIGVSYLQTLSPDDDDALTAVEQYRTLVNKKRKRFFTAYAPVVTNLLLTTNALAYTNTTKKTARVVAAMSSVVSIVGHVFAGWLPDGSSSACYTFHCLYSSMWKSQATSITRHFFGTVPGFMDLAHILVNTAGLDFVLRIYFHEKPQVDPLKFVMPALDLMRAFLTVADNTLRHHYKSHALSGALSLVNGMFDRGQVLRRVSVACYILVACGFSSLSLLAQVAASLNTATGLLLTTALVSLVTRMSDTKKWVAAGVGALGLFSDTIVSNLSTYTVSLFGWSLHTNHLDYESSALVCLVLAAGLTTLFYLGAAALKSIRQQFVSHASEKI